MKVRLVACLVGGLAMAAPAYAETWRPIPGEPGAYYDSDFLKIDEASGLVVLRYAMGKGGGPYKAWPGKKSPILVYAVDCPANTWIDLGFDYDGAGKLPKGWRNQPKVEDISAGVGHTGILACETRDSLPKAALP